MNKTEKVQQTTSYRISYHTIPYPILSYHNNYPIVVLKWQNHLKAGTDKPKLKVKMQSLSDDDVQKRLLEKPRFELAAKGVFRLGRCYIFWQGIPGLRASNRESTATSYLYCKSVIAQDRVIFVKHFIGLLLYAYGHKHLAYVDTRFVLIFTGRRGIKQQLGGHKQQFSVLSATVCSEHSEINQELLNV